MHNYWICLISLFVSHLCAEHLSCCSSGWLFSRHVPSFSRWHMMLYHFCCIHVLFSQVLFFVQLLSKILSFEKKFSKKRCVRMCVSFWYTFCCLAVKESLFLKIFLVKSPYYYWLCTVGLVGSSNDSYAQQLDAVVLWKEPHVLCTQEHCCFQQLVRTFYFFMCSHTSSNFFWWPYRRSNVLSPMHTIMLLLLKHQIWLLLHNTMSTIQLSGLVLEQKIENPNPHERKKMYETSERKDNNNSHPCVLWRMVHATVQWLKVHVWSASVEHTCGAHLCTVVLVQRCSFLSTKVWCHITSTTSY